MTSQQTENNEYMTNDDERGTVTRTTCCPVKIGLLNKKLSACKNPMLNAGKPQTNQNENAT